IHHCGGRAPREGLGGVESGRAATADLIARHTFPLKLTSRSAPPSPPGPTPIPRAPPSELSPHSGGSQRTRTASTLRQGGGGPRAQVKGPQRRKGGGPHPSQQPRFREAHVAIASDDHVVVDGRSSSRPASTSCRVTVRSSADGDGSPLGWLCTTMIPAAGSAMAARNTSRG